MGFSSTFLVPVIYVCFGSIPDYLLVNIELASRNNHVIVLTNHPGEHRLSFPNNSVTLENLSDYDKSSRIFAPQYRHMSKDHSKGRVVHESRCFERWFILRDYMQAAGIPVSFFGDGDSSVFVNMSQIFTTHGKCDSVINIERQGHNLHWVGAGESSFWTVKGLDDFCRFTLNMYQHHLSTLEIKQGHGSSVVDMSLLWLWWVAHHESPGWEAGRPLLHENPLATPEETKQFQNLQDDIFQYSKKLKLAEVNGSLSLCNGLDVVQRTVFDHQLVWEFAENFSINFQVGVPEVTGACLRSGGKPESVDPKDVEKLSKQKLSLNNVHYQGDAKRVLIYDVCRVLLLSGPKKIHSDRVRKICEAEVGRHPGMPCMPRKDDSGRVLACT